MAGKRLLRFQTLLIFCVVVQRKLRKCLRGQNCLWHKAYAGEGPGNAGGWGAPLWNIASGCVRFWVQPPTLERIS